MLIMILSTGASFMAKFWYGLTMLYWNKALWLDVQDKRLILTNQSALFQCNVVELFMTLGPGSMHF